MMSVMAELTTKGTREDGFNIISPLAFVIISPLGVLVPLVLVAPSGLVLWGLIPALTWVVVIPVLSFLLGIVRWMSWVGCIQLFKTLVLLSSRGLCYPRYLGITRRSCLEAHMVLDMEYREQELT
jgi:hypothetical protein